jgi:hypothetical protein
LLSGSDEQKVISSASPEQSVRTGPQVLDECRCTLLSPTNVYSDGIMGAEDEPAFEIGHFLRGPLPFHHARMPFAVANTAFRSVLAA